MLLENVNPYLRFASLQPSVISSPPLGCSYDYRIFYILEGNAKFVLKNKTVNVSSGMLIYFRPGTPYYFDGNVKIIVLNFDLTRNNSHVSKPFPPSRDIRSFKQELITENDPPAELENVIILKQVFSIKEKIQECLQLFCQPTPYSDALTSSLVKNILCFIVQKSTTQQKEPPKVIQKIISYIQQNYDKNLSNIEIAKKFNYHPYHLNRIFKQNTGITIHQTLINERLRIAKYLLKETDLSIDFIATEVGYVDRSQFCNAFKKYVGITPTVFRKK